MKLNGSFESNQRQWNRVPSSSIGPPKTIPFGLGALTGLTANWSNRWRSFVKHYLFAVAPFRPDRALFRRSIAFPVVLVLGAVDGERGLLVGLPQVRRGLLGGLPLRHEPRRNADQLLGSRVGEDVDLGRGLRVRARGELSLLGLKDWWDGGLIYAIFLYCAEI